MTRLLMVIGVCVAGLWLLGHAMALGARWDAVSRPVADVQVLPKGMREPLRGTLQMQWSGRWLLTEADGRRTEFAEYVWTKTPARDQSTPLWAVWRLFAPSAALATIMLLALSALLAPPGSIERLLRATARAAEPS